MSTRRAYDASADARDVVITRATRLRHVLRFMVGRLIEAPAGMV